MIRAFLAAVLLSAPCAALAPQGSGPAAFAVAFGPAAYAIVTDAGATTERVIVRRLSLDGGVEWEDRWGEGRNETPVGAAVTSWGGLSVAGDDDAGCVAAHWSAKGRRLWAQQLQYGGECHARSVLTDSHGATFVLGTTTNGGVASPVVWKIDRQGSINWTMNPASGVSRYGFSLTLDSDGVGVTVTVAMSGPNGWTYESFDLDENGRPR